MAYTANKLDQYSSLAKNGVSTTPTYDANGNLTYDGTFTLGYDAESHLTSAAQTGVSASYAYDAQGRRKQKVVGTGKTVYVTDDANREILNYDGTSGAILNWIAYGPGSNDVLNSMNGAGTVRTTFVPDYQGSFIATLDSNSGALTKSGNQAYGESATTTGSFRYSGQRIDPETNGLYYFRARMYSPALGRFLQPDPIGIKGGVNLYGYVTNDPLNRVDLNGLTMSRVKVAAAYGAGYAVMGVGLALTAAAEVESGGANTPGLATEVGTSIELGEATTVGLEAVLGVDTATETAASDATNVATYGPLKAQLRAENLANIAAQDARLAAAINGTGNFGIGTATEAEADALGRAFVGDGYTVASDGRTLLSADETMVYRPPSVKANTPPSLAPTGMQANFVQQTPSGQVISNGHLDVTP